MPGELYKAKGLYALLDSRAAEQDFVNELEFQNEAPKEMSESHSQPWPKTSLYLLFDYCLELPSESFYY